MKNLTQILFAIFVFIFTKQINAQNISPQLVSAGGNYQANANAQLTSSIGEPATETASNAANQLTQGFMQNNYTVSGIFSLENTDIDVEIYPNPVDIELHIILKKTENKDVSYVMSDLNGKILSSNFIIDGKENISVEYLKSGIYFVDIFCENKPVKTYKIVKNK